MTNQSFSPVSSARWANIKTVFAQQAGVQITSDTGTGVSHGVHFTWAYGGDTLAVTVVSVPWALRAVGLNEQKVTDEFKAWVDGVQ
jgi:hypothetical protein